MYDMNCAAVEYRLVYKPGQKQPPPCFRLKPCFFLSSGLCRLIPRRLGKQDQRQLSRLTGRSSHLTYTCAMGVTWRAHSRVGVGQLVTGPLGFLNSGQLSTQNTNEQLLVVLLFFYQHALWLERVKDDAALRVRIRQPQELTLGGQDRLNYWLPMELDCDTVKKQKVCIRYLLLMIKQRDIIGSWSLPYMKVFKYLLLCSQKGKCLTLYGKVSMKDTCIQKGSQLAVVWEGRLTRVK